MNVSRSAFAMSEIFETADRLSSRVIVLLGLAGVFATMGLLLPDMAMRLACAVGAGSMIALIVIVKLMALRRQKPAQQMDKAFFDLVGMDAAPCFATDDIGQIVYQNAIAIERFGPRDATTLVSVLKSHFTAPDAILYRLQNRAGHQGHAREDVVTRRGHLRLSVHRVAERQFLWRLEEFQDRVTTARGGDTLSLPMLVVNKAGVVLFCNDAARRLVAGRPKRLEDVFSTDRLYSGEEVVINAAGGPVRAILAEVEGPGERREIYLLPVAARTDDRATLTDFEELPVALMKFTSEGALVAANRAARELVPLDSATGVMAHEIFEGLGRPIADWLADVIAERLPAGGAARPWV
jgi:two-component system, cell cycle sensor histidine kinase and response regulator CckA